MSEKKPLADSFIRVPSDKPFFAVLIAISSVYVLFIIALIIGDLTFTTPGHLIRALQSREILFAMKLSMYSCTGSMILSLITAIPIGYIMARYSFPGKILVDAILDIPIILPPLVIGLSLLILFQTPLGRFIESYISVTYAVPSIILAQYMVACAFAVRTMTVTFAQINPRTQQVALTLGCSQLKAFFYVVLPEARKGILTAASLAWARALGEFGPILIFSGATRMRTEVLPTTVFLEMSVGNIEVAVAVSLVMIAAAFIVLILLRTAGKERAVRTLAGI
jgi:molybdate transport system permease protein